MWIELPYWFNSTISVLILRLRLRLLIRSEWNTLFVPRPKQRTSTQQRIVAAAASSLTHEQLGDWPGNEEKFQQCGRSFKTVSEEYQRFHGNRIPNLPPGGKGTLILPLARAIRRCLSLGKAGEKYRRKDEITERHALCLSRSPSSSLFPRSLTTLRSEL